MDYVKALRRLGSVSLGMLALSGVASAAGTGIDSGDTAWVLVSAAMVTFMIPGVALFYGGMVRRKNVLSTLTMVLGSTALVGVQWVLFGYSLAFGPDVAGVVGGLEYVGLAGLGGQLSGSVPHLLFAAFQGTFAAVTVALIVGGIVGRMKFGAWMAFALLWTTLVYDPIAHWVWGGGWLSGIGGLDFAGGTVVHVNSGASALALVLVLGARKGFGEISMEPHDVPMTVLGAAMLWFGWFGFNAGSALGAGGVAATAFISTNTAAAAGAVTWMMMSWRRRAPSALGLATGAVSGLVAITPAAGYVTPLSAVPIGAVAGVVCYYALIYMKERVDESLDVWAVHGVGGIWGALATGVFAEVGAAGLLAGNPGQLYAQALELAATTSYAFLATLVIAYAVDRAIGLRVEEKEEDVGLDLSQHGEKAYSGGV